MIDLPIKALSIRQPWVWAILNAGKRIENRPRRFHYRGPICLHASLYEPKESDYDDVVSVLRASSYDIATMRGMASEQGSIHSMAYSSEGRARGGIVGTAEIVDLVEQSDSPWFFGPYGLVLENVQPVDFIPVKGALGLFDWRKNL